MNTEVVGVTTTEDECMLMSGKPIHADIQEAIRRAKEFNLSELSIEGTPSDVTIEGGEFPRDLDWLLCQQFKQHARYFDGDPFSDQGTERIYAVYSTQSLVIILTLTVGEYTDDESDASGSIRFRRIANSDKREAAIKKEMKLARNEIYGSVAALLLQCDEKDLADEFPPFMRKRLREQKQQRRAQIAKTTN